MFVRFWWETTDGEIFDRNVIRPKIVQLLYGYSPLDNDEEFMIKLFDHLEM